MPRIALERITCGNPADPLPKLLLFLQCKLMRRSHARNRRTTVGRVQLYQRGGPILARLLRKGGIPQLSIPRDFRSAEAAPSHANTGPPPTSPPPPDDLSCSKPPVPDSCGETTGGNTISPDPPPDACKAPHRFPGPALQSTPFSSDIPFPNARSPRPKRVPPRHRSEEHT